MTVLLDYLCLYFKCCPSELNEHLTNSVALAREFENWKYTFTSQYSFFETIHFSGFTKEPANRMYPYGEDTLEELYKRKHGVALKYPNLICVWEHIDENIHKYYPLELIEIDK